MITIHLYGEHMKIIIKNHCEEYALREIIYAIFPKEKLEFTSEIPMSDDYIFSQYIHEQGVHKYFCKIRFNNICCETENFSVAYNKTAIKKSIADVLKKVTGIHLPWGLLTGIRPSKIVREYKESGGITPEKHLTDFYETDLDKAQLAIEVENNETSFIQNRYKDGVSLYIGIPFCPSRCLYCSFTSQSLAFSNKLTLPYIEALKKEIIDVSKMEFVKSKKIETIYFGGGTPSALSSEQIDDIINTLQENFDLSFVKEITFEAGRPDTIEESKLNVLKKHGISRICINPQTVNDKTLKLIGRNHDSKDFFEKFDLARSMGFTHINCDIIAGLPGETEEDFSNTLYSLEKMSPESITVHTMSIKHGSYLDMNYDMYSLTAAATVNNMLNKASYHMKMNGKIPYYMYRQKNMLGNLENVGYCDVGHECLYNIYIMEEVQSIIALGAGGSTKVVSSNQIERVFNVKEVSDYIKRIDEMIERKRQLFAKF